jgi:hypothetical protein
MVPYSHCPIRLDGVVLNKLNTKRALSYILLALRLQKLLVWNFQWETLDAWMPFVRYKYRPHGNRPLLRCDDQHGAFSYLQLGGLLITQLTLTSCLTWLIGTLLPSVLQHYGQTAHWNVAASQACAVHFSRLCRLCSWCSRHVNERNRLHPFAVPFCLQSVPLHPTNCVTIYTVACRRMVSSALL